MNEVKNNVEAVKPVMYRFRTVMNEHGQLVPEMYEMTDEYLEFEKTFPEDATLEERNELITEYFNSHK